MSELIVRGREIDLDAEPWAPDTFLVTEHQKGGVFEWDPAQILLRPLEEETDNMSGMASSRELFCNANLLDFLLGQPHLTPEEWKGKAIFFRGTTFNDPLRQSLVRYLYWKGCSWDWDFHVRGFRIWLLFDCFDAVLAR